MSGDLNAPPGLQIKRDSQMGLYFARACERGVREASQFHPRLAQPLASNCRLISDWDLVSTYEPDRLPAVSRQTCPCDLWIPHIVTVRYKGTISG